VARSQVPGGNGPSSEPSDHWHSTSVRKTHSGSVRRRGDRALGDRVTQRRVRLRPAVTVIGCRTREAPTTRRSRASRRRRGRRSSIVVGDRTSGDVLGVQAVRVAQRGVRHLAQVAQDDRRRVPAFDSAQIWARIRASHRGLRDRAPRVPRLVLAQLVDQDQIARQSTAAATVRGLDLVPLAGAQLQGLLAVGLVDALDLGCQVRDILSDVDCALPYLLGDVEVLRRRSPAPRRART
jgi:hypothetical protein